MFTYLFLTLIVFLSSIILEVQPFQVTFRKNITLAPGEYYYINHTYDKEFENGIIDYIDQVSTSYSIALVNILLTS